MKFYYKGQLVRTSKSHDYKWAVIEEMDDGGVKIRGCRAARQDAETEARYWERRGHTVRVVPLDTEPTPPALTYEEFIALAKANYTKGGDGYVECWDERTFDYYAKEFGPITKTQAMQMFDSAFEEEKEACSIDRGDERGEW